MYIVPGTYILYVPDSTVVHSTRIIIISLNRLHLTRNGKETLFILLLEELELYVYVPDNIPESQRSLFEF